jgi:hypothetical protein
MALLAESAGKEDRVVTEVRVHGRSIVVAGVSILVAALALAAILFALIAFQAERELRATAAILHQAEIRADVSERALLQCDARRQQFEELLGLTAWRRRGGPEAIGPTGER